MGPRRADREAVFGFADPRLRGRASVNSADSPDPWPVDAVAEIAEFRDGEIAWLLALYEAIGEDRRRDGPRRYVAPDPGGRWGNAVRTWEEAPARIGCSASTPLP